MRNYRGLTKEGKWVYGWFLKTHNPTTKDTHWIIKDGLYATDIIIGINNTKFPKMLQGCYPVIPETVGQQVGHKDKKGKEIYKGDRIRQARHIIGSRKKEEGNVEQANNGRYFVRIMWESGMECHADIAEDAEIIGNIYQNPEEQDK